MLSRLAQWSSRPAARGRCGRRRRKPAGGGPGVRRRGGVPCPVGSLALGQAIVMDGLEHQAVVVGSGHGSVQYQAEHVFILRLKVMPPALVQECRAAVGTAHEQQGGPVFWAGVPGDLRQRGRFAVDMSMAQPPRHPRTARCWRRVGLYLPPIAVVPGATAGRRPVHPAWSAGRAATATRNLRAGSCGCRGHGGRRTL